MAKREIGTVLKIDGEAQFKSALSNINQELRVLSSEMGASMSAFDKNATSMDALKTKSEIYDKEIEAQKSKLEILEQAIAAAREAQEKAAEAVRKATEEHGENSKEARKAADEYDKVTKKLNGYEIQANNTTKNINQLEAANRENNAEMEKLKGSGADKILSSIKDGAKKAASGIADMVENIAKLSAKIATGAIEGYAKAIGAVGTAAAGAATVLGKEVVTAYADYEQLVGGVDTLFGESSQKLQDYAANAYKTAGMNANDYMETVTGFSASLIQSLGGDTEKAVDYASMAITDMSDNANKMGTDISSIQTAYQGFAKQNYTMLDNLKLGYGGTKEEMQRLLDDASAISGIEYDVGSYADIVSAIHVIQENMDIAGATAAEAESTISGSISAMQSAAQNLVVGLGNDGADIQGLCTNLTTAFGNVVSNIEPVIQRLAESLPTAARALLGAVEDLLPQFTNIVMSILPELTVAVVNIAGSLVQTITGQIPGLIETVLPVAIESFNTCITGIIAVIPDLIPIILEGAVMLFSGMLDGLNSIIEQIIPMLPDLITNITNILIENIPELITGAVQFFTGMVQALTEAIPAIVQAVTDLIPVLCDTVIQNIPLIIQAGLQLFVSLVDALPDIILGITAAIPDIITGVINVLTENIPLIIQTGIKVFTALVKALPEIIAGIVVIIPEIISSIVNGFSDFGENMLDVGKNIIAGIGDGLIKGVTSIKDKINSAGDKIMQSFKDFFGIASPSKLMKEQVGFNLADGVAIGFTDQMGKNSGKMAAAVPKDYSIGIVIADEKSAKKAIDTITADYKKSRLTAEQADTALLEVYKTCEQQKISIVAYANEKITTARKDAADEDMKTLTKAIETEIKAYEKQMQDIEKEIQSTANSLSESYKSMYTFETDEDGNILSAKTTNKMKNATKELDNYYNELERLSGRNISETMVKQLSEMSMEEGAAVAAYWNTLSDEELNALNKNWKKYQDSALKVSEWFHADEMEQAASDMISTMSTTFSENGEALDEIGIQLVEGIKDGMTGKKANSSIREMCDNFVKQFKDYFGFASPSKLMKEQIGFNLADGVSGGFVDRMKRVSADMNATVPTSFGLDVELKRPRQNEALSGAYGGRALNFTQINNSPKALDAATINRQTRQGLQLANCMR